MEKISLIFKIIFFSKTIYPTKRALRAVIKTAPAAISLALFAKG